MTERRALLLTDLVDSTATSETLGDAAATALWAQHDRVARDLIRGWNGREIDKTDGMLVQFETVPPRSDMRGPTTARFVTCRFRSALVQACITAP